MASIRSMAAAEMGFYPADTARVTALLQSLIEPLQAEQPTAGDAPDVPDAPRAAIAPHAGYRFSGATAARALLPLLDAPFERVVLIGPSHREFFDGVALSGAESWATPFGRLPVDQAAVQALIAADPLFHIYDRGHAQEHSLEVELPFLHLLRQDFQILPLVLVNHHLSRAELRRVADALAATVMDASTVLVVSSDFTHYGPRFRYTPFGPGDAPERLQALDGGAIDRIVAGDPDAFQDYVRDTGATICGSSAIAVALELERHRPQPRHFRPIAYTSSGELLQDYANSVSYAALTR